MVMKNKILVPLVQTYQKRKRFRVWTCQVTMTNKGRNRPIWKCHWAMTKKDAFTDNELQLLDHSLTFFHKNKTHLSTISILSRSPMAHNTTASFEKITCTDYVDFGNFQDKCGRLSRSQNDSNYLDVKQKVFKRDANRDFRLVQNLNGRSSFQPVHMIQESASQCSRKLWQRGKSVITAHTNNVQRHGWTTQTGSQGDWRSGPSKYKHLCDSAAVQCDKVRELKWSSSIVCKEDGLRNNSTNCLCEI